MADLFEKAARLKLRFATPKGFLTVEDLFDLPLTSTTGKANLDDLARELNKELKAKSQESFVEDRPKADEAAQAKFEVVLSVIQTRKEELKAAKVAAEKRDTRQRVLEIIDRKQNAALESKSLEELTTLVNSL
jgi:hypothetical protein